MSSFPLHSALTFAILLCLVNTGQAQTADDQQPVGVAIVELFTSQGCSSCPPADVVLRKLDTVAQERGLAVHCLSFHVDYWNRLGWEDPYSSPIYSQRQRAYAVARQSRRVYTPQMIVNGSTEFNGSNQVKAQAAISKSLAEKPTAKIELDIESDAAAELVTVGYRTEGELASRLLHIALVQPSAANSVPRGENAGRDLSHANVVRAFKSMGLSESDGSVQLRVPSDMSLANAKIIAYIQDPKTLAIVGATSSPAANR